MWKLFVLSKRYGTLKDMEADPMNNQYFENTGTCRSLTPKEIGYAVASFREVRSWKQSTLAAEAGVTERTVQRIENGEKASDETLRKVAQALGFPPRAFIGPRYIRTPEEAAAYAEKTMKETFGHNMKVSVGQFTEPREIIDLLSAHGLTLDDRQAVGEALEAAARLKDLWEECNMAFDHLSHAERLDAAKQFLAALQAIQALGYIAKGAVYQTEDDFTLGMILLIPKSDWKNLEIKTALVPRKMADHPIVL